MTLTWSTGPIEKGANDGQITYAKDIIAALRAAVSSKAQAKGAARGKGKSKKKREAANENGARAPISGEDGVREGGPSHKPKSWGILEPLHGPLGPLVGMVETVVSAPTVIGILVLLLAITWLRTPSASYGYGSLGVPGLATPQRIAAYEEMWRKEESELWKWLEDRVAMDHASAILTPHDSWRRQQEAKEMEAKLQDVSMSERQMDEAIRVTQKRLEVLKEAVERKKRIRDEKEHKVKEKDKDRRNRPPS